MIRYTFIIGLNSHDVTPINVTDISSNFSTPDENFASVHAIISGISVNQNNFISAGLNDFSMEVQKYEECTLQVYEDNILLNEYKFSYKNIKFDDFKKVYNILFIPTDGIEDYKNGKSVERDLCNSTLNQITLSASDFQSSIYGWIKVYYVLSYFVKKTFGTDYTFSSILFGTSQITKDLYICQASNVIKAAESLIYDKSKIFPLTFETLLIDLRYLFNIRIYVTEDKVVRIERFETFENEKSIEFNAMDAKYTGYLTHQKEYTFDESDSVKSEIFKSVYVNQYFEDKSIEYANGEKEIEYQLQGYTDLSGVLTDSQKYSELGYFFGISVNQTTIEEITQAFPNRENYNFTSYSEDFTYSEITDENEIKIDTTVVGANDGRGKFIIQSEEFIINSGAVCQLNDSLDLYVLKSLADSQNSDSFFCKVQVFIADTTLKNENNLWINAKISDESLSFGNVRVTFIHLRYDSRVRIFKGSQYYYFKLQLYGEFNINVNSQNAVILYSVKGLYTKLMEFESHPLPRTRPNWIVLNSDFSVEGTQTFTNHHLAFKNTVPEYQKYDRYDNELEFDGVSYNWNSKRLKKGDSILSLDKVADFNSSGFVFTQFEKGEIESADLNHFKKELVIKGKYYNELSKGTEANILDFYFDGIKYLNIVGNTIVCEAIIGTDLSTLIPTITISKYATYDELNVGYEFNNRVIVTSQDGLTQNQYTVIITIAKPRFYYNGFLSLINIVSLAQTQWIHNNGVINIGLGWSRYGDDTQRSVVLDNDSISNITTFQGQGLNNTIDLSGFTSLTSVQISVSNIYDIILEDLNYELLSISTCVLRSFTLENFTNLDNTEIILSDNDIDPNKILIEIDSKGWVNGEVDLSQTRELNAYGLIAKTNIEAKGWNVTI